MTTEIERALRHPVTWTVGAILSVLGVASAFAVNPVSFVAALFEVFVSNASMVFTASSIAGFTIGPEISQDVAQAFTVIAIGSGIVVVLKVLNDFWDRLERKIK